MINDLKFALRQLSTEPGFLTVALVTLALGIGVNTTTFSILNVLMYQKLPYPESGKLVRIYGTAPQNQSASLSPANYLDVRAQTSSFAAIGAFTSSNCNLAEPGQLPEQATAMFATADFFPVLGLNPILGRVITSADEQPGHNDVAVISHGFWIRHFGGDPSILGRVLRQDGDRITIIGVMPQESDQQFLFGPIDLWRPQPFYGEAGRERNNAWLRLIARLKPGVSLAQAQAELNTIATRLEHDYPQSNAHAGLRVASLDGERGKDQGVNLMIMALAVLVQIIACANLANLQLARTTRRAREHAIRLALGASRWQLMRQLLVESLVVSLSGGALGVLIASWSNEFVGSHINIGLDEARLKLPLDLNVLGFAFGASFVTGICFGLLPAFLASRADVNASLKQGTLTATGDRSRHRLRDTLIVTEIAFALVLLTGAVFFIRSLQRTMHRELGWNPNNLLTGALVLPIGHYNLDQCRVFYNRLEERLTAIPGVQHAAITKGLPIFGLPFVSFTVEGRPPVSDGRYLLTATTSATPDYFATIGLTLVKGRAFTSADNEKAPAVVIINESMARKLWPGESPLGKRIGGVDPAKSGWQEIVGVVNDIEYAVGFAQKPSSFQIYRPLAQTASRWVSIALRSATESETLGRAVREAVQQIDPDEAIYHLAFARKDIETVGSNYVLVDVTLAAFAALGLLLSAVGIYGVIANLVVQRTREFGIRLALGAQKNDVIGLLLRKGVVLVALGSGVGLAGSWAFARVLATMIPTSLGQDVWLIAAMVVILAAVALLACWLPSRRATNVDPLIALRAE